MQDSVIGKILKDEQIMSPDINKVWWGMQPLYRESHKYTQ